jgi:protoheme IX farnesyltransferase
VVFCWTPVHYWPLAMRFRADYARAGVPMLPVVAPPITVVRQILRYGWLTVATSLLLWPLATGWLYGAAAVALGGAFLLAAHRLYGAVRRGSERVMPMRLFHLSNSYLALLFLAVAADALLLGR